MEENTFRIIQATGIILQTLAILFGAGWAYFRLRKERSHEPHVEFTIDCLFYGPQKGEYIVEVLLIIHNKGLVQHKFFDMFLQLRGIKAKGRLSYSKKDDFRLDFPLILVDEVNLLPENYNFFFVEPGISQPFTYATKIPATIKYVLTSGMFYYDRDRRLVHRIERVFPVKATKK